jgi:hypothetical protein
VRRPTLNLLVDVTAFAGFALMTTTGVLMRYLLPSGSGRWLTIWGLHRHQWAEIHFWVSSLFLSTLAVHVFLHWRWIVSMVRGRPREGSGLRAGLGLVGLLAVLALAAAPLCAPLKETSAVGGRPHGGMPSREP